MTRDGPVKLLDFGIAQLLAISEGSVKAHAHRGLQALQQRIEVTR